jgi:excisionase family DNA binding protein
MQTLTLLEAAAMLNTTPETVSAMIRNERLPAAKIGRAWVLVDVDVIRWLRGRYAREEKECTSSGEAMPMHGGAISGTRADALEKALARATGAKRRSTRTDSKPSSGDAADSANVRPLHGTPPS